MIPLPILVCLSVAILAGLVVAGRYRLARDILVVFLILWGLYFLGLYFMR